MSKTKTASKSTKGRSLASLVDDLYSMREERYKAQNAVKKMEKEEDALEDKILNELRLSKDTTGISGKAARAQLVKKEKVVAEDWDKVYAYILKTKSFELLQRRLADTAVKERWENKIKIPGVNKLQVETLSLTKV